MLSSLSTKINTTKCSIFAHSNHFLPSKVCPSSISDDISIHSFTFLFYNMWYVSNKQCTTNLSFRQNRNESNCKLPEFSFYLLLKAQSFVIVCLRSVQKLITSTHRFRSDISCIRHIAEFSLVLYNIAQQFIRIPMRFFVRCNIEGELFLLVTSNYQIFMCMHFSLYNWVYILLDFQFEKHKGQTWQQTQWNKRVLQY